MINVYGSLDYLKAKLKDEENFKNMVINGDTSGWGELGGWSEQLEERLNLLKELIKYKELYLKVEKQLEDIR